MNFKEAFSKFYDSKMTITVNEMVKEGNITKNKWVEKVKDVPCRISKRNLAITGKETGAIDYQISLYCDPNLEVPAGSRISVTDTHGTTRTYKRSSEGFSSYNSHQEILLVREVVA